LPGEVQLSDFADLFEIEVNYNVTRQSLQPTASMRNHCGVGKGELAMLSNGDIFPCQLLCKPQFLAGNIFDQPLNEIFFSSEVLNRLRDLTVDRLPGCSTCDVKYVCAGGCRATALELHGSVEAHSDYHCDFYHRLAVDALWKDSMVPVQEVSEVREEYLEKVAAINAQRTEVVAV
jgi:radical SAM protein with 4Fe4S-binding SPASM domain